MFENVVKHVMDLDEKNLPGVSLEDVAICAAWFESYTTDEEKQEAFGDLSERLHQWRQRVEIQETLSLGRRHQPLLRQFLDELPVNGVEKLERDELDFLYFAWELMAESAQADLFQRPMDLMKKFMSKIQQQRECVLWKEGLPTLADRIRICTEEEVRHGETRDVKNFAGLDLPIRGPVASYRGDLKVIGGVPEGATLVVEDGHCYVDGLVQGVLALTNNCDIRDNISGVVVSRKGDIRAAAVVNQATAISKEGRVYCYSALEPKMLFGAQRLEIATTALWGSYISDCIQIGETLEGAQVQASERVAAKLLKPGEERDLSIVLRRGLSCLDYGEVLSQDAQRLYSNAIKFTQKMTHVQQLLEITEREADEYAGGILLFLLGEDDTTERIQKLQRFRSRAAFLDRLSTGIKSLIHVIEDRLNISASSREQENLAASGEEKALMESIQHELNQLASETTIDRDLFDLREDILHSGRRLQRKSISQKEIVTTMKHLLQKNEDLSIKREEVRDLLQRREGSLEKAVGRAAILNKAKEACNRVEILQQLIDASRGSQSSPFFKRRVNDRYVRLMRRNIENRLARCSEYRSSLRLIEEKVDKNRQKLWNEYMVSLPEGGLKDGATVTGSFEDGVRVCAWKYMLESTEIRGQGLLKSEDSNGVTVSYRRTTRGLVELVEEQ